MIHWRRERLATLVFLGFPGGSAGKETSCNAGDLGSRSGLGRSPGEGIGYPLQYSGLENSMDCIVHGVAKSLTWLRNFHFPLSQLCYLTVSYSASPFSFFLQSFPASGSFLICQLFTSGGQNIRASASVLPMNIQEWSPLGLTCLISLMSKGLWRVFSST